MRPSPKDMREILSLLHETITGLDPAQKLGWFTRDPHLETQVIITLLDLTSALDLYLTGSTALRNEEDSVQALLLFSRSPWKMPLSDGLSRLIMRRDAPDVISLETESKEMKAAWKRIFQESQETGWPRKQSYG